MAGTAMWMSVGRPRQGCSSGTCAPMIHSPPLSMKRVSEKLSRAQRIAAQEEGESRPTQVTMPEARMETGVMGKTRRRGDAETRGWEERETRGRGDAERGLLRVSGHSCGW